MAAQPSSLPNEPPAEIKALIDMVLSGFNNKESALYTSAFGADAVVIDGIAPYRWTEPNAPARWLSDAEKLHQNCAKQGSFALSYPSPIPSPALTGEEKAAIPAEGPMVRGRRKSDLGKLRTWREN